MLGLDVLSVAVGTAAITQAELAVNYTEIVVAQVAEDVWEGHIEPPWFHFSFDRLRESTYLGTGSYC